MNKALKTIVAGLTLASAALTGCAAQQSTHEHPELLSRIQAAERAAAEAQQAAARAQTRADEAASMASANSQKVDRAFQKSQQK